MLMRDSRKQIPRMEPRDIEGDLKLGMVLFTLLSPVLKRSLSNKIIYVLTAEKMWG